MVFTSYTFIAFFIVVYGTYLIMIKRDVHLFIQNSFLLVASYVFYGAWNYKFLSLLAFTSMVDYFLAIAISQEQNVTRKKGLLTFSIVLNLGVLFVFKYLNFGIESAVAFVELLGLKAHLSTLSILLPVGISFFTFQSMSYTIDVYRGEMPPAKNLRDFLLFVSFFPQLVAGPIERAQSLLPQLQAKRTITRDDVSMGTYWIVIGYFKKLIIADTLAPLVEYSIENSDSVSGVVSLLGIVAFALQIYGDFAGYTYIARGVAKLMGIDLTKNFDRPYLATSPRDFWKRWHISLSVWLKIYLYFSLGGSKHGRLKKYRNLLITMVLGGIWHGASWNFVIWGFYHGLLLVGDHAISDYKISLPVIRDLNRTLITVLRIVGMFCLTLFGWLLFRVTDVGQIWQIASNIALNFRWTPEVSLLILPVLSILTLLIAFHSLQEIAHDDLIILRLPAPSRVLVMSFMIICILVVGVKTVPFIYFQF